MNRQTVIFFGSSGSGKGTQADLLIDFLKKTDPKREVEYIETGKLLREFAKENDSETAQLTAEIINSGGLMPEFMPIFLWTRYFIERLQKDDHLICDGISRRINEAPVLDSALNFYGRQNEDSSMLYIKTSSEWSRDRLLERGRTDDTEEGIQSRISWFYENTIPALELLKNTGNYSFLDINGEQSIEDVHKDIIEALGLK
jgi:adenylate kinase